jgi:hypothetical protein
VTFVQVFQELLKMKMKGLSPVLCAAFCVLAFFSAVALMAASSATSSDRFDGPAELPRVLVKSSLADTPTPGHIRLVKESDNLQQAIDSAECGDTLQLQSGAVFQGLFRLPAKPCDDAHWIILRTSAPNNSLPPEGTRLTPCYAGVVSLPARPDYHCSNPRNVMARIEFAGKSGMGPILFRPGAHHYRLLGLEITRSNPQGSVTALVAAEDEGSSHHLIFDRVWVHGTAQSETRRGIALSSMTYVGVVDSFFSDFHCVSVIGSCTDSQTISAGGGDRPEGPFKIANNFLEAAGENLIFGGRPARTTPADIEIRGNHLFKPMTWMRGQPGFVGGLDGHPFIVKNHFELKNAQRVLFEDNLLENSWGGFSQTGFSVLLTPKNQENKCPICLVTDVTIRFIKIVNVGSAFQIANALSDAGGASSGGERYSIHDVLVDGVRGKEYQGFGLFAMIISVGPPLRDVRIEHVTSSSVPRFIISFLGTNPQKMTNFTVANNILSSDQVFQIGSAGGGPRNCAFQPEKQGAEGVFKSCFENSTFTHNVIAGGANWPPGNFLVKDLAAAGVRLTPGGDVNRYRLCTEKEEGCKKASPAIGAGTDGKDIGADVKAIETALEGII